MGNITLKIPDKLHEKMRKHGEIRWSEVVRRTIEKRISDLELLEKLTSRSNLTEKDALEISKKVNASVARKLGLV